MQMTDDSLNDLIFMYGLFFGAMLGGRVGYMFFYGLDQLLSNPLSLFFVWEGGLSFHGGLIGVVVSIAIFAKRQGFNFWKLADMISVSIPIGLFLVRIGNFLNGELYGSLQILTGVLCFQQILFSSQDIPLNFMREYMRA